MTDNFNGDMIIILDGDGADIVMENGNIYVDSNVMNAINIATNCGSNNEHYNLFIDDESDFYESKVCYILNNNPITIKMLADLENAYRYDLRYFVDNNIIVLNSVKCVNTNSNTIETELDYTIVNSNEKIIKKIIYDNGKVRIQ